MHTIRTTTRLALVAAACGVASADSVTVTWNSRYTSADTVRLWADVEITGAGFEGFASTVFDVIGDDTLGQTIHHDESAGLGRRFRFDGAHEGTVAGDDILSIDAFQMPELLGDGFDGSSTLAEFFVFEYRITDFAPRTVTYTSLHRNFSVYTDGWGSNVEYDVTVVPTSFDIAMIPLPPGAALAAVGLAGVGLSRRRPASGGVGGRPTRPAEPRRRGAW